jgi:hypothetical protein
MRPFVGERRSTSKSVSRHCYEQKFAAIATGRLSGSPALPSKAMNDYNHVAGLLASPCMIAHAARSLVQFAFPGLGPVDFMDVANYILELQLRGSSRIRLQKSSRDSLFTSLLCEAPHLWMQIYYEEGSFAFFFGKNRMCTPETSSAKPCRP